MEPEEIKKRIVAIFETQGWTLSPREESCPVDVLATSRYACVCFKIAADAAEIVRDWGKCQDYIHDLKQQGRVPGELDCYLLFVVDKVASEFGELRRVFENTGVCRKMCVETRGRSIEDTIADLPFVMEGAPGRSSASDKHNESLEALIQAFPDELFRDFAKASADSILDKMLQGIYKGSPHEN